MTCAGHTTGAAGGVATGTGLDAGAGTAGLGAEVRGAGALTGGAAAEGTGRPAFGVGTGAAFGVATFFLTAAGLEGVQTLLGFLVRLSRTTRQRRLAAAATFLLRFFVGDGTGSPGDRLRRTRR